MGSLQPETAQLLIARLQQEDTFGRPVQSVMEDAEPLLSKLVCLPLPPNFILSYAVSSIDLLLYGLQLVLCGAGL